MTEHRENLNGNVYGKLTVIGFATETGRAVYLCRCECGTIIQVTRNNLLNKYCNTRSCGCSRIKHDKSDSSVYNVWKQMKQRCQNPNNSQYHDYGGRGITVDPRWLDFANFLEDMGEPTEKATLERIDNNKGYSPANCKWATWKEQHQNRRNNRLVTAFGKTQCVTAWADEYGIKHRTLFNRLFRAKMTPEDALTKPQYAQQRKR